MTCREECFVCHRLTTKIVRSRLCADCAVTVDQTTIQESVYRWSEPLNRARLQRMAIYAGILAAGMRIFEPTPEGCS